MTTAVELSDRYANFLTHPLVPGPGVCRVCTGPAGAGYAVCRPCHETRRALGSATADAVVPISLAPKGEQYANELWRYKNAAGPQRHYFRRGLAAVLWRFLVMHERCAADRCAVARFDAVTTVPSTHERTEHPLRLIVADMVGATRDRHRDLLIPTPRAAELGRLPSGARYTASPLRGENVLLIDDTWASGNHAQSAAAALKAGGAGSVAIVVLGRHLNGGFGDTAVHVERARLRRFSWNVCPSRPWSHD
ncbi:hypothetical protein [Streptomyces sp. NPDC047028]|uniref:hypothetical protein n=1 Tax=Streptomyces sp. NPDC047028 TaxID=3155793 RepID=UPI0033DC2F4A